MHGTLSIRYPDGREAAVDIDRDDFTIGRSANCDAILDHRSVSSAISARARSAGA